MSNLRNRLENYVVRQTSDVVDDLSDDRRKELAEVLHDIEGAVLVAYGKHRLLECAALDFREKSRNFLG